jgi:hypothetical protein
MKKQKNPTDPHPLFIRLTAAEKAELVAAASAVLDERGRPTPPSTWARRVLLKVARGQV